MIKGSRGKEEISAQEGKCGMAAGNGRRRRRRKRRKWRRRRRRRRMRKR